jgi:hypothetical protein
MVDTTKQEVRKVGLAESVIKGTPLAMLSESQRASMRVAVSDFTYAQSDASVKDAAELAKDTAATIGLFGTTLPIILIILGAVALAAGGAVVALVRR